MKPSPAWDAELSLLPPSTSIKDRGTLLVIRSEEFPNHIWKNFILLDKLPDGECSKELVSMFRSEFPGREFSIAFGWNQPPASRRCIADLKQQGFITTRDLVLSADSAEVPYVLAEPIILRECMSDSDWELVLNRRIEFLCGEPFKELKTKFESDKFQIYRALADAGRGSWFISSTGGQDVADLGVYYSPCNGASIEELLVYPAARRRGLGVATIRAACHISTATRAPDGFITVVDNDNFARRLRNDFGFSQKGFIERGYWHKFMKSTMPPGD